MDDKAEEKAAFNILREGESLAEFYDRLLGDPAIKDTIEKITKPISERLISDAERMFNQFQYKSVDALPPLIGNDFSGIRIVNTDPPERMKKADQDAKFVAEELLGMLYEWAETLEHIIENGVPLRFTAIQAEHFVANLQRLNQKLDQDINLGSREMRGLLGMGDDE